ncbi:hypothetical protein ACJJTC_008448 [Scirpophaga incertulas]
MDRYSETRPPIRDGVLLQTCQMDNGDLLVLRASSELQPNYTLEELDRCSEHSSSGGRSVIGDTTKREVGFQEEKVSGVSIALRRKVWSLIWSEEETRSKPANEE